MYEFHRVLTGALLFVCSASGALAEPLTLDAKTRIIGLMLDSTATMAFEFNKNPTKDAQAALAKCRDAEKIAARYDHSPYHHGLSQSVLQQRNGN